MEKSMPVRVEKVSSTFYILDTSIDREMSYKQARDAGGYDYVSPDINPDNFPMSANEKGDKVLVRIGVFTLGKEATHEEVVAYRRQLGLQPIGMEHQFAVGQQFSDFIQRELHWVANMDVLCAGARDRKFFSFLQIAAKSRSLSVRLFSTIVGWDNRWWILGLCEE